MKEIQESLKCHEEVYDELKFFTNSLLRMQILLTLYERPCNMKEIRQITGLAYSAISTNLHILELHGYSYRESNKYYISNAVKMIISNIVDLNDVMNISEEFCGLFNNHIVQMIPSESINKMYVLSNAELIESNDIDTYKIYNIIEKYLNIAKYVNCILPFFYENFNQCFNDLIRRNKQVNLLVQSNIRANIDESLNIYNKNLSLSYLDIDSSFLLVCTDKIMILGLFRDNGYFDQNRILTSRNEECMQWAEDLFKHFKKEIVDEV